MTSLRTVCVSASFEPSASTGGVITAAGLIFAASMFGLLFASIGNVVQGSFVVGIGLLLDTFLVRTITVPAVGGADWQRELVAVAIGVAAGLREDREDPSPVRLADVQTAWRACDIAS